MSQILDFLLNLDFESYTLFIYLWASLGILAGLGIYWLGDLPISGKMDNYSKAMLGSVDKKTGWIIMETPVLISVVSFYWLSMTSLNVSVIILAAFVIHYVNRALIYPHRIKAQGKRMPVSNVLLTMSFYTINGYLIGYYLGALRDYPIEWLWDPRFIIGCLLFVCGFWINIHSDNILLGLRKPGETGYKIPKGGFFKWVSCPNYFGEIVEWAGFALMSWSLPGLMYALWVALPLISQALLAHRWYQATFADEYPKERKALIPFLF